MYTRYIYIGICQIKFCFSISSYTQGQRNNTTIITVLYISCSMIKHCVYNDIVHKQILLTVDNIYKHYGEKKYI